MLGFIKSVGNKAISSLPLFSSKTKIITPIDPHLEQKLNEISSQILKAQPHEQFKVYQQLQSPENADFNRNLRKIYQHEECTTEMINAIIRFYTFLLTNCKNELVVCKLVSEPLVIELTKIVLQVEKGGDVLEKMDHNEDEKSKQSKQEEQKMINQSFPQQIEPQKPTTQTSLQTTPPATSTSLHYLSPIDWDQVNAYKVALIRSYINCINPDSINYMIIDNQLPIFVNCINGFKHYLSEGVEGTCLSNCILMILTKVNHNDEVCEIIFDEEHCDKSRDAKSDGLREKLAKSISNEKSIKLHVFVKQVITKISIQLSSVLENLQQELNNSSNNFTQITLKQFRKLQTSMEFIESNILFCVDLINSINNYNYTTKIKNNIGEAIERELIGQIVEYVEGCRKKDGKVEVQESNEGEFYEEGQIKEDHKQSQKSTAFQLTIVKLIKFVLNLSITCQKQSMIINFLNKNSPTILQTLIDLNQSIFPQIEYTNNTNNINKEPPTQPKLQPQPSNPHLYSKQCLTYMCDFSLILLKQTISPYSRLASRKRLQISRQVLELKESILSKIFVILEQLTKSQELKQGVCYKGIRNILLCVFYLTIKQDKCGLSPFSIQISQEKLPSIKSPLSKSPVSKSLSSLTPNLGLLLQFKYSILLLHKIFSQQFKSTFSHNRHWQFIVNNYESLMRQVPNTILTPEQSDKHCHYHNGHNYPEQDRIRDMIMVCEAVRNYRYMIIHETKLEDRLIRLENIYHKHFMSPGWNYYPGETIKFTENDDLKVVCVGLLHNNSQQKLPIQILQDFECLLISHKLSENTYKVIANIRYKKIHSFVPQAKNLIRMKLIGIQELILQFSSPKVLTTFKQYLNQNRNKTRQKELKFISYYLNMYLKDTCRLIQEMYDQDLVGLEEGSASKHQQSESTKAKKLSFDNIEVEEFGTIQRDQIPEQDQKYSTQNPKKQNMSKKQNSDEIKVENKAIQQQVKNNEQFQQTQQTINHTQEQI